MDYWLWFWLAIPFVIALFFGWFFGKDQKNYNDYFRGGGNLPWWALTLSIVATETSTLTFVGIPALAYGGNWLFLQVAIGYIIGRYFIASYLLPAYWRGDVLSAYGYIRERYGNFLGRFVSILFIVTRILADGVRLFATALPIKLLLDISLTNALLLIAFVTILYTFWGGLKAVVWMDVLQFFFYVSGAFIAIAYSLDIMHFNFQEIFTIASDSGKLEVIDFQIWNGYGFLISIVGGALLTLGSHGTDHIIVQRILAASSLKQAQKALRSSGWLVFAQFTLFLFVGTLIFVVIQKLNIQPVINNSNEIFPWFIIEFIPPFFKGLIVSGLVAAAMSTLSSSLNALAGATISDLLPPLKNNRISDLSFARLVSIFWGFVLIVPAVMAAQWGNVLEAGLGIASVTYVFLITIFICAVFLPKLPASFVFTSGLFGLIGVLIFKQMIQLHWLWTIPTGLLLSLSMAAFFYFYSTRGKSTVQ